MGLQYWQKHMGTSG